MMATVWAFREDAFEWKDNAAQTGWSHVFKFHGLSDLVIQLRRASLMGQVTKLGIVAHGDTNGFAKLDRGLTFESAPTFKAEFLQLHGFLIAYARVIFFSCIAGGGAPGTKLLNFLSGHCLPHRHVIGFEVFGDIGTGRF